MQPHDLETNELIKQFASLRDNSQHLPIYANEINQRNDIIKCTYVPARGKLKDQCPNEAVCKWGYCGKHKNTLQARKLKDKFELGLTAYEKIKPPSPKPKRKADPTPEPEPTPETSPEVSAETSRETSPEPSREPSPEPSVNYTDSPNYYEDDEAVQIKVRRNPWGNYEHKDTKIVFDMASEKAYGVQHPNGNVYELSKRDIAFCIKHGWPYKSKRATIADETDSEESEPTQAYETNDDSDSDESSVETKYMNDTSSSSSDDSSNESSEVYDSDSD